MKRILLAGSALALSACQSVPYVMPEATVPAQWAHQTSAPTSPASLADRAWSQVFEVPELTALIEEALIGNSDLRVAVERVELARAQYGLERAALLPSINVAGSATRQRMPGADPVSNKVSESANLGLVMPAWEIDLWGRLAAGTEAARRDLLSSAALAQGMRISIAAQVSTLYLDLLDLDNQLAITQRTLASRQQSLRLTRARFDEGVSSILDVRQSESLVASSEQSIADQRRRLAQTENALSVLVGRNPGPIVRSVDLDAVLLPTDTWAGLPSDLLQRRPDILAAEESLRGASANVEAARKAFLPRVSLSTMLGFASPALSQLFNSGRYAWSLQPAIGLPLFDAGRLQSGVELAQAQQRILVEQYQATIRQAFREVSDALISLEELGRQRDASHRVVVANRDRARISRARYLSGISSYFEVLDAERQLFDSEVALSQLMRTQYQAVVQLYRALGGGWRVGMP
ncbi:MAG: efflux transporter outer membrane subunit [Rhodoferax sp.]|uniref:efflux transporter outer membrane subunit n=1 Tax=Rhodoferax sp. TaxID=50421 RepID=UPI001B7C6742|nr:efflux transporter outer membrane subunit [Rhodoferax sp.]MBP9906983.1 efflux transporter outer membrane subunit [Rhodoferax sp.]